MIRAKPNPRFFFTPFAPPYRPSSELGLLKFNMLTSKVTFLKQLNDHVKKWTFLERASQFINGSRQVDRPLQKLMNKTLCTNRKVYDSRPMAAQRIQLGTF